MFGMLDYRAHNLYWLLELSLRVIVRIILFVAILASILIGQFAAQSDLFVSPGKYGNGTLSKIVIAYVAFELISMVNVFVFTALGWTLNRLFFFCIGVVPAHGANVEEAKAIACTDVSLK